MNLTVILTVQKERLGICRKIKVDVFLVGQTISVGVGSSCDRLLGGGKCLELVTRLSCDFEGDVIDHPSPDCPAPFFV